MLQSGNKYEIRPIRQEDDKCIADVIRKVFIEYRANRPGTAFHDKCLDFMSTEYSGPDCIYYVCVNNGRVIGGAGIYPLKGVHSDVCELVKMYLLPEERGKGIGKSLLELCTDFARVRGYKYVYLETMPELKQAICLYQKSGFIKIQKPLGDGKHFGCTIRMIKPI